MAVGQLKWDLESTRKFQLGVDHGVLYPTQATPKSHNIGDKSYNTLYHKPEAWSGLISVSQNPDGAEPTDLYADNMKYATLRSAETFGGTVECYDYPDGFKACNGEEELISGLYAGQQSRKPFGFSYRTKVGNDTEGQDYAYKIHLVYGNTVSPSEESFETINDSPEGITMSYEFKATPTTYTNSKGKQKATAHLEIDSWKFTEAQMTALENVLYGTDAVEGDEDSEATEGYLPSPDEVAAILLAAAPTGTQG